jgi:hypothetical protein
VRNLKTDKLTDLPLAGIFFAIGARQSLPVAKADGSARF